MFVPVVQILAALANAHKNEVVPTHVAPRSNGKGNQEKRE